MDIIHREDIKKLINESGEVLISFYIPTAMAGRETEQGAIRLKNLIQKAETQLEERGMNPPEIQTFLKPVSSLLEDALFWEYQSDGLALFLSSEGLISYRLPLDFEDLLIVSDHFYVKPLFPLIAANGHYYVLALSLNEVRLLHCTRYTVAEMDLQEAPTSLKEALWFDDKEKELQYHAGTSMTSGGNARAPIYHGHGVGTTDNKSEILRFFQRLDNGMQDLLNDEQIPLVLAGVDYLLPIYKESNHYSHLVGEGVEGNPEELSAKELHNRAWAIVEPRFSKAQREAVERYERLANMKDEKVSDTIEEVVPAAFGGRVDTLFVASGVQQWGTFERQSNTAHVHAKPQAGDQDLLNSAAAQTFLHDGNTYLLAAEEMVGDSAIAAILRY